MLVVIALGITWILDGLEVTLAGSVAAALQTSPRLHLTAEQVGLTGSAYLAGAVLGALFFGHLTDRLGRKKLFNVTLGVYLVATAATAFSWDFYSFLLFRFLTGAGIGGEYSAINSAIQELIPARLRGRIDLAINGSFWLGAAGGALLSVWLLDPTFLDPDLGWRLAFGSGAVLGLVILYLRRFLPESPRWLMIHGKPREAEGVVEEIEARVVADTGKPLEPVTATLALGDTHKTTLMSVARHAAQALSPSHDPGRGADGFPGLRLQRDLLHVRTDSHALLQYSSRQGRPLHPAVRDRQFPGPAGARAAVRQSGTAADDRRHLRDFGRAAGSDRLDVPCRPSRCNDADGNVERGLLLCLCCGQCRLSNGGRVFSARDPGAHHRAVLRLRTLFGGVGGPWLFGVLIQGGNSAEIMWGYLLGAGLMIAAALVTLKLGVAAEGKSLEEVAPPLSSEQRL